jgi:hypothetical protein
VGIAEISITLGPDFEIGGVDDIGEQRGAKIKRSGAERLDPVLHGLWGDEGRGRALSH